MRFTGRLLPRAVLAVLLAVLATLLVMPRSQAAILGDDYPSSLNAKGKDQLVDPWRFYNRECTSFVAWRITSADQFPSFNDFWLTHWGNASNWKAAASTSAVKAAGVTVDNTPTVGAVAWWSARSVGSSVGHVAWVAVVNSTSITIEEYNYLHEGYYDTRTISRGSSYWPGAFLHFPPQKITNTAKPAIKGTPRVGTTLTASAGSWTSGVSLAYQWLDNGKKISGRNASTYTVAAARLGHTLSVKVTASKTGLSPVSTTSPATAAVAAGQFATTASPTITGTAKVGVPLTATAGTWTPAGTYAYQWFAGGVPVDGATGATFTPGVPQVGLPITVAVTATKTAYTTSTVTSAATAATRKGTFANTAAPSISGVPQVGVSVTASPGSWSPEATYAYQWKVDGTAITGATGPSYTPTRSEKGKELSVSVTASADGYNNSTLTTAATPIKPGQFADTVPPSIVGTPQVGVRSTVSPGTWTPTASATHYQWLVDGSPVGTDATSYTPKPADDGKALTVRVTVSGKGYSTRSVTTPADVTVEPGTIGVKSAPVVSGTPRRGETLTASAATWSITPAKVTYQWYAGDTAIEHATKHTYVPTTSVVGQRLHVVETAHATGYTDATSASEPTATITYGVVSFAAHPTVTGERLDGHTLTAHVKATTPAGASLAYQWYRGRERIAGATQPTYILGAADIGHGVWVRVRGTAPLWTAASSSSQHTTYTRTAPVVESQTVFSGSNKRTVTLKLTITAAGGVRVYGAVTATEGKRLLHKAGVHHHAATLPLGQLSRGKHTVTIHYAGTHLITALTKTVTVTVR